MSKITVVDSICGAGKTSWAIQFMDNNFKDRYIYITPFLEEMKKEVNDKLSEIMDNDLKELHSWIEFERYYEDRNNKEE